MSAKPSAPSGKDCQKQCDILVWFMSHPWLLTFATVAPPLNSKVCAPGPVCRHPRLSNTDGTLSNLTAARAEPWGVLRHWHAARKSKKKKGKQNKERNFFMLSTANRPMFFQKMWISCEKRLIHRGEITTKLESWMWHWADKIDKIKQLLCRWNTKISHCRCSRDEV